MPIQEDRIEKKSIPISLELKEWITDIKYILEETEKSLFILFDTIQQRDNALIFINHNKRKTSFVKKYVFNAHELRMT